MVDHNRRSDPVFLAREKERNRLYQQNRRSDPVFLASEKERKRLYQQNNKDAIRERKKLLKISRGVVSNL
jgi:hypothetical protein